MSSSKHTHVAVCTISSPLLDLRAAQGGVDALVHNVPIDLVKHLVNIALLGHEERALAKGHGLEQLHSKTARAHLGCKPYPALAIVLHLLSLIHAIADATLGHKHRVLHLRLEAFNANLDVLLADGARRRALPQARVALEALRRELTMEELHDELRNDRALRRVTASARDSFVIECLNVSIRNLVLPTARLQRHRPRALLAQAR